MAVTARFYGSGLSQAYAGGVNFASDTIKVALVQSGYIFDQALHENFSDITNEATGTGYTAGGATLGTKTSNFTAGELRLDAADVVWPTSTITASYAVIYKDTGVASSSTLLGYVDFGSVQSSSAGDFTITWDANGIFVIDPEPYTV